MSEPRFCTNCKHFEHMNGVAHQSRCAKFKDKDGISEPVAFIRVHGGRCDNGAEFERADR